MNQQHTTTPSPLKTTTNTFCLLIGWFSLGFLPLTGPLQSVYEFNRQVLHGVINAFPAGLVAGYILFGYTSDHWKTKTSSSLALGLWGMGILLLIPATAWSVIAARFLWGVGCGSTILMLSIVGRQTETKHHPQTFAGPFAWMLIGNSAGILVMTAVVAWSSSIFIWIVPFLFMLFIGGWNARTLVGLPETRGAASTSVTAAIQLIAGGAKTLRRLFLLSFFSAGAAGTFMLGLIDTIVAKGELTEVEMWIAFAIIYLLSVAGASVVLSQQNNTYSDRRGLTLALIAAGIMMLLPLIGDHALLPSLLATTIPLFFVDTFWSSLLTGSAPSEIRGSLTALGLCIASAGRFVIPTLAGHLPLHYIFLTATVSAIIAAILAASPPRQQVT